MEVYVGAFGDGREAYILEQLDFYGAFDEYKIFLGFFSLNHAQETFRRLSNPDNEGRWVTVPAELIAGLVSKKVVPKLLSEPEKLDTIAQAPPAPLALPNATPIAADISVEGPDEPTNAEAAALADDMTKAKIDRCEHNRVNECEKCGVERVRGVLFGDDGEPLRDESGAVRWKIAWRAIQKAAS